MRHPKPVKDVETSDGRTHEVDLRQNGKSYTAWAFVDKMMIEGVKAATEVKAVANWKKVYDKTMAKPIG